MFRGVATFKDGSSIEVRKKHIGSLEEFQKDLEELCQGEEVESIDIYSGIGGITYDKWLDKFLELQAEEF